MTQQFIHLQALGYAIGHSLWQMGVLLLVCHAASAAKGVRSPFKYFMAVVASVVGLVFFVGTYVYHVQHLQTASQPHPILMVVTATPSSNIWQQMFLLYGAAVAALNGLAPFMSTAYLVVVTMLLLRLVNGFRQITRLRTVGLGRVPADVKLFVQQYASRIGIKHPVQVFVSSLVHSPLTIGFLKPIILIPLASINQLTTKQMEAVLLHELAHILRHDYLINLVLQAAEILLFFNPFMRLLLKQARLERENSCDDFVLQFQYGAADYARALLAVQQHSQTSLLALCSSGKNKFQLFNRIKRMVAPERKSFGYKQQLGLLLLVTGLGVVVALLTTRPANEPYGAKNGALQTVGSPMAGGQSTPLAFNFYKPNAAAYKFALHLQRAPKTSNPPNPEASAGAEHATVLQTLSTNKFVENEGVAALWPAIPHSGTAHNQPQPLAPDALPELGNFDLAFERGLPDNLEKLGNWLQQQGNELNDALAMYEQKVALVARPSIPPSARQVVRQPSAAVGTRMSPLEKIEEIVLLQQNALDSVRSSFARSRKWHKEAMAAAEAQMQRLAMASKERLQAQMLYESAAPRGTTIPARPGTTPAAPSTIKIAPRVGVTLPAPPPTPGDISATIIVNGARSNQEDRLTIDGVPFETWWSMQKSAIVEEAKQQLPGKRAATARAKIKGKITLSISTTKSRGQKQIVISTEHEAADQIMRLETPTKGTLELKLK